MYKIVTELPSLKVLNCIELFEDVNLLIEEQPIDNNFKTFIIETIPEIFSLPNKKYYNLLFYVVEDESNQISFKEQYIVNKEECYQRILELKGFLNYSDSKRNQYNRECYLLSKNLLTKEECRYTEEEITQLELSCHSYVVEIRELESLINLNTETNEI